MQKKFNETKYKSFVIKDDELLEKYKRNTKRSSSL